MWFEFITNTKCNWNCSYCAFDRVPSATMTKETINKHKYVFDIIRKLEQVEESTIVVEGGEIGLIKDNSILLELFKQFDNRAIVNTNGEFFKDDRAVLYPYIKKYFYHIAPDAKKKVLIGKVAMPAEIIYGVVDDNWQFIDEFVAFNKHLEIRYTGLEMADFSTKMFNETKQAREDCIQLNPFVSIDLAREVLCMCSARGCHVTIPLTEENFIKVLTEENVFGENDMCKTCYRTCKSNDSNYVRERKKKFKEVLNG